MPSVRRQGVSIHAPAKERRFVDLNKISRRCFNPRSREGATPHQPLGCIWSSVSIHAPAKERPLLYIDAGSSCSFNPRSREGATLKALLPVGQVWSFNPRSREGATFTMPADQFDELFQSTLPRRSDSYSSLVGRFPSVSIHAPAKERLRYI